MMISEEPYDSAKDEWKVLQSRTVSLSAEVVGIEMVEKAKSMWWTEGTERGLSKRGLALSGDG